MSSREPTQAPSDSEKLLEDYEDVLKTYTQSFDEDYIPTPRKEVNPSTRQLEANREEPTTEDIAQKDDVAAEASPAVERGTVESSQARRISHSPAPSASSSSSALTYVSFDPTQEAEARSPPRVARPSSAFKPLLPEQLTSRQPTPSQRSSLATAPRPSTQTIPSPFLAATTFPPTITKVRESGGGAMGEPREYERQRRSDSLEPPRLDLGSPFAQLPPSTTQQEQAKKDEVRDVVDDWTKRFLEADRKLKASQMDTTRRRKRPSEERPAGVDATDAQDDLQATGGFDGNEREDEEELPDPSRSGTRPRKSARLSSPIVSPVSSGASSASSPPAAKTKKTKSSRKKTKTRPRATDDTEEGRDEDESSQIGSIDEDMTVEKSLAMLPKWKAGKNVRKKGRRPVGIYSEIDEEEEEGEGEEGEEEASEEEEETDYDEPASSFPSKRKTRQTQRRTKASTSSSKGKGKSASKKSEEKVVVDMTLGDRTNRSKWREIDAYSLETWYTL
ncbi:uncharacterized protein JCM6883_004117 [Sporobolomyces salmoneus]|uniref:uncharacterized protein n=1 Tax=Sporobolomyces salmoneus TaxID=183962 RepID=UPI003172C3C9